MVVELTDSEVAELLDATGQSDPSIAVRTAMREYLRYVRRMELKTLSGQVEMDDNWRDLEAAELRGQDKRLGVGS